MLQTETEKQALHSSQNLLVESVSTDSITCRNEGYFIEDCETTKPTLKIWRIKD